ncbi:MAG: hypothetical protein V4693_10750 [Pseudomonadota bacterium]
MVIQTVLAIFKRAFRGPVGAQPVQASPVPVLPSYFTEPSWSLRRQAVMAALPQSMGGGFAAANAKRILGDARAKGRRTRMHVVFNLGADALLNFLRHGEYLNAYQRPIVNGKARQASRQRVRVDELIAAGTPENRYFCALAMGGTGISFYGEYCAVLRSPADEVGVRRVLDRNSFDLIRPPIQQYLAGLDKPGQRRLIDGLGADFRSVDCADMVAIKVLQTANAHARLITTGTIGAALLDDEDFIEAYHEGPIAVTTLLEVRERFDEIAMEAGINARMQAGQSVPAEELLWSSRRDEIRKAAHAARIDIRGVSGSGRTKRWR